MKRTSSQLGFSLIELLIVMTIIGLIASLIGPAMFGKVDSSKIKTAQAQMQMLGTSIDTFRLDVGKYPDTLAELLESSVNGWDGPYFPKAIPADPWGNGYVYQVSDNKKGFRLLSKGPNGTLDEQENGDDIVL